MPHHDLDDLRAQLADRSLAVCRHYLSSGRRCGSYWTVGDVQNRPGRSLYVRLQAEGNNRRAGRWSDVATGEYGDLLDIIRMATPSQSFPDAVAEALAFIGHTPTSLTQRFRSHRSPKGDRTIQARRLYDAGQPIAGTLGEIYLRNRFIDPTCAVASRFAASCYCRPTEESTCSNWPALLIPVTDLTGTLTGIHRQYLDPRALDGPSLGKAPLDDPKRSLGNIRGNAARFGPDADVIVVGEGIENPLSVRTLFPDLTVHAALNAGNLASYRPHPRTRAVLIAADDDHAGHRAVDALMSRLFDLSIEALPIWPIGNDHNIDLRTHKPDELRSRIRAQVGPWLANLDLTLRIDP